MIIVNWIAVRGDATAITGQATSCKEACKAILNHIDAWCEDIKFAIVDISECQYTLNEIREIANS